MRIKQKRFMDLIGGFKKDNKYCSNVVWVWQCNNCGLITNVTNTRNMMLAYDRDKREYIPLCPSCGQKMELKNIDELEDDDYAYESGRF